MRAPYEYFHWHKVVHHVKRKVFYLDFFPTLSHIIFHHTTTVQFVVHDLEDFHALGNLF